MRRGLSTLLLAGLLASGCQPQSTPSGTVTPAAATTAATPAETPQSAGSFEVKVPEGKDVSFEPKTGWFDPRGDVKSGTISLGNYDFVVTPKSAFSVPDVTEGQSRVVIQLKSPEGAKFEMPIPTGDYVDAAVSSVDVFSFADGSPQHYSFSNPKGKVVVSELGDTEMSGSADLTDDKGASLKGDFKAKITTEATTAGGKLPVDFPAGEVTAKAGDTVFAPMASEVADMMAMGTKRPGSFLPFKMVKPGPESSTLDDHGKEVEIPNALIVSMPKDAKAKVGDLMVSYPQYGSMERAIVTDASAPTKPKVHFFKPIYGDKDPASDDFSGQLEPGTFKVLEEGVQPGGLAYYSEGDQQHLGHVINVSGDKALVVVFNGDLQVFDKSELTAPPLKPKFKVGDKVIAPFGGGASPGSVSKLNEKLGRVWVKFENNPTEGVFTYGEVLSQK